MTSEIQILIKRFNNWLLSDKGKASFAWYLDYHKMPTKPIEPIILSREDRVIQYIFKINNIWFHADFHVNHAEYVVTHGSRDFNTILMEAMFYRDTYVIEYIPKEYEQFRPLLNKWEGKKWRGGEEI
jgi:hypothetical protein